MFYGIGEEKNAEGEKHGADDHQEGSEDLRDRIDGGASGNGGDDACESTDQRTQSPDGSGGSEAHAGKSVDATCVDQPDDDEADVEQRCESAAGEREQVEGNVAIHQAPRAG